MGARPALSLRGRTARGGPILSAVPGSVGREMTSLFDIPPITTAPDAPAESAPGRRVSEPRQPAARRTADDDRAEKLLEGLNGPQRAAVEHRGSPLLVVAGAGSGKTRVLTRRIAHLLATGSAEPGEILAITFTNKAAREMKDRVADLVGRRAGWMWVSTFHSMCVRILRAEAAQLGMKSTFTIYDQADSQRLTQMVGSGMHLDPKRYPARSLAAAISNLKNELIDAETAADRASNDQEKLVAQVYDGYQARLKQAAAFDFDDLIMQTVGLLQTYPAVAEHYRRRFRHVLVDEYQDTNHAQYMLVRELVGGSKDTREVRTADGELVRAAASDVPPAELVVVGDADQSIYAFRGATIRNIVEFERDYPDARTILLEQNYRSTQNILNAANSVIARDPHRRAKNLWTAEGNGVPIIGYVGDNEHDEAQFVGREIDALMDAGDATYGDVAVFYRTNAASRALEDVFVRTGMPYRIVGGVRFYERKEVKDALAYLRAIANPDDEVNLRRILNTPRRGIGDRAEAAVASFADRERIGFGDALQRIGEITDLAARSANSLGSFAELLAGLRVRGRLRPGAGGPAHGRAGAHRVPGRARGVRRPAGRIAAGEPRPARVRAARDHREPAGRRRSPADHPTAGEARHRAERATTRARVPAEQPISSRSSSRTPVSRTTTMSRRTRPTCSSPSSSSCRSSPTRTPCPTPPRVSSR